jgi:protein-S-isoprenylcysteine O-methyltransferase Ste14
VTDAVRNPAAVAISIVFFALAPGVVAGAVPALLTDGWTRNEVRGWWLYAAPGVALIIAGSAVLVDAFVRYVIEGNGTPAPPAPTEQLVVGGPNRYLRNPMYVAVVAIIVGQGLLLAQPVLVAYAAAAFVVMATFVHYYEEPALVQRFGAQYDSYRNDVRRWLPRGRHNDAASTRNEVES